MPLLLLPLPLLLLLQLLLLLLQLLLLLLCYSCSCSCSCSCRSGRPQAGVHVWAIVLRRAGHCLRGLDIFLAARAVGMCIRYDRLD